jgi:hypothetical protein
MPDDQDPWLHQLWHRFAGGGRYELADGPLRPVFFSDNPPPGADGAVLRQSSYQTPPEELPPGAAGPWIDQFPTDGSLPGADGALAQVAEPIFQFDKGHECTHWFCPRCGPLGKLMGLRRGSEFADAGIGQERVVWAISEIEPSQPLNNFRIRVDSAYRLERPDRAEYFWSKPGLPKGPPLAESLVDYQELRFLLEAGGPSFSVLTELPLRIVDPVINNNTAGLGDVNVATKVVMLNGSRWQISQVTRTYMNTSVSRRGLGAGHFSLEPGLLFRFKYDERTYVHHEIKFWFPLDGDPDHSGEVLRLGIGVSRVLHETDAFAVIPTLEFVGWSVLDGLETPPPIGPIVLPPVEIDPEGIFNIHPGVRFVADTGGDLGLFELGISGSFSASRNRWYEGLLRVDLRWSY